MCKDGIVWRSRFGIGISAPFTEIIPRCQHCDKVVKEYYRFTWEPGKITYRITGGDPGKMTEDEYILCDVCFDRLMDIIKAEGEELDKPQE